MKITKVVAAVSLALLSVVTSSSYAYGYRDAARAVERVGRDFEREASETNSFDVAAKGKLEVAFSPNEGSEHLVKKVIDSAKKEILVLSYSFTSAPVTESLVKAVHRGVSVRIVADYKSNVQEDKSGKARAALSALRNAGADVRVVRKFPIHHDKVVVVDRETVELGSFNYSDAAARRNSENVLVNWGNPDLASVYLKHFERNYKLSEAFSAQY